MSTDDISDVAYLNEIYDFNDNTQESEDRIKKVRKFKFVDTF
jgi:hypothetical protein